MSRRPRVDGGPRRRSRAKRGPLRSANRLDPALPALRASELSFSTLAGWVRLRRVPQGGTYMAVVEIPARKGKAALMRQGQTLKVINTKGQQVVDTWAFNATDLREFMSMEHSRVSIGGIIPKIGSVFVTNKRRPILTVVEDTSGGIHDTLIAACDRYRYDGLGC